MAILSMCFSLIQEEIVSKFRWVGQKLGLISKEEEEEEREDEDDEVPPEDYYDDDPKKQPIMVRHSPNLDDHPKARAQ